MEQARGAERFYRLEQLGSGGNGVVHRALDLTLGVEVAIKYLNRGTGRDLYRFKREFRALAEITHPNLVRLYELFVDGDEWFFTMELVQGKHLREHLRDSPEAIGETFCALADGLRAIHALGKIHRDIKPTNVLVTPEGRVVVLDFGLVRGADPESVDHTHEALAVGTPAFMSPEQALDQPLNAATDWYAVGAMLYEALCGRRPFDGPPLEVLRRRVAEDPPPPRKINPAVPPPLDALCMALLERDPAVRAGAHEIYDAFGRTPSLETQAVERAAVAIPFIGRSAELAEMLIALDEAAGGACVFMPVIGGSGTGKSALVRRFVDSLDEERTLVLEGRCHEREHMPYQGIESLVDAAATLLMNRPTAELWDALSADIPTLAKLFPSLMRVPAIATPRARRFSTVPPPPHGSSEMRRRAVAALGELLTWLAGERTLVVVLDDLQWSDADGGAVLAELVRHATAGEKGALFIAASRSAVAAPPTSTDGTGTTRDGTPTLQLGRASETVTAAVVIRELELGPLSAADVASLARAVAPAAAWRDADVDALMRASGGMPLLATELATVPSFAAGGDLEHALAKVFADRIERLPGAARALLAVCAVSSHPLALEVAALAAGGDAAAAITVLRAERLVRTHRRGAQLLLEPAHDRVRAAALDRLDDRARREHHARLATALEGRSDTAAIDLVEHCLAAGEAARAAAHARVAAEQAEEALAFHVAAELYRTVLETQPDAPDRAALLRRQAACLADAGRLDDALAVLGDAATTADPADRRAIVRRQIELLLQIGRLEEGIALAHQLSSELGLDIPDGRGAVLRRIVFASLRARLRGLGTELRGADGVPPEELERIDTLWALTSGLVYVDPTVARLISLHHQRAALACGEKTRVARALTVEVAYVAQSGSKAGARLAHVTERARQVVDVVDRPETHALFRGCSCVAAALCGDWRRADELGREAEQALRAHPQGMRWVLSMTQFYRVLATWYLGRTDDFVRLVPTYIADAEDAGDLYTLHGLRSGRGNPYWLVVDRPDEARAMSAGASALTRGEFLLYDYFAALSAAQVALYTGDGEGALAAVTAAHPRFSRSLVRRIQLVRIEWHHVTARAAIAAAAARKDKDRARALSLARTAVKQLASENAPWTLPLEHLCRAAIAHLSGDGPAATDTLDQAAASAASTGMSLHATVAKLLRGAPGQGPILRARGILNPSAMVRLIAPGWS